MRLLPCIVLLVVAGCTSQQQASRVQSDDPAMAELRQIQSWIPTNAPVADVQHIMEQRGFHAMILTNRADGSGSVLCSRVYSNATESVCLAVTRCGPVLVYLESIGPPVIRPPNPQGGANGRQPPRSEDTRTPAAAASRRSP